MGKATMTRKQKSIKRETGQPTAVVGDADADGWVYGLAPPAVRGYLKLARLDRPVGVWLLLWPCWWSLTLATPSGQWPDLWSLLLFAIGAVAMRGAGCTYNDIIDRNIDAQVERTAKRPIPAGEVSRQAAAGFLVLQALVGLAVLVQFNRFTILLGAASLLLVAAYPFMKRITWWPQAWLGLTFNWGALMGWAAVDAALSLSSLILYGGCVFWTLGYDTIYAHQDREDDALIGVKSSARRLGRNTRPALVVFYGLFLTALAVSFALMSFGPVFAVCLVVAGMMCLHQIWYLDIDNSSRCLALFKANIRLGGVLFGGMVLDRGVGDTLFPGVGQ